LLFFEGNIDRAQPDTVHAGKSHQVSPRVDDANVHLGVDFGGFFFGSGHDGFGLGEGNIHEE